MPVYGPAELMPARSNGASLRVISLKYKCDKPAPRATEASLRWNKTTASRSTPSKPIDFIKELEKIWSARGLPPLCGNAGASSRGEVDTGNTYTDMTAPIVLHSAPTSLHVKTKAVPRMKAPNLEVLIRQYVESFVAPIQTEPIRP